MGMFFHIDDDEKDQEEHSMFMNYEDMVDDEQTAMIKDHTTAISFDENFHRHDD